jgi:hypothetical protein
MCCREINEIHWLFSCVSDGGQYSYVRAFLKNNGFLDPFEDDSNSYFLLVYQFISGIAKGKK